MATINFLYRSTKNEAPLNLRLLYRHKGNDFVFGAKTKLKVSKQYWSKQHTQQRPKDIEISNKQVEINSELNKIEKFIIRAFDNANPVEVNKDWLKKRVEQYYNRTEESSELPNELLNYFEYYIKSKKSSLKNQTYKNYNTVLKLLQRFQDYMKTTFLIKDFNLNFQNEFEQYCYSQNYAVNTTAKAISKLLTVCRDAKFHGKELSYQFEKIKPKNQKTEKIYLTESEIELIEAKTDLSEYHENAKDWLIISCYTGQRVSDFMRFTPEMIRYENDKPLLEFTQKKTDKIMTVPLHPKVMEILNKRNGNFPRPISSQKYNDYIKEVCEKAEINELVKGSLIKETKEGSKKYRKESGMFPKHKLVSSHIGRRSFASNFYGKIPTTYLIYITGHSSEKMFLNYIGKSNKDLAMEISNYF